jgi:hypothetical protein
MRSTGIQDCVPTVPADQLALDRTAKRLRQLRWMGKELEAQRTFEVLDDSGLKPPLASDRREPDCRGS